MPNYTPKRWRRAIHPAFLAGVLLTGVGIAFNVSHGWHLGGSDELRAAGMAGVFLAAIVLKDSLLGQVALALRARRFGLALVCTLGFALGAIGSMIAAFGSASEGRDEKADPRQAQIVAYKVASDSVKDAEARLADLGRVPTVADASARVSSLIAGIDGSIAKRTSGCTVLAPEGSGKRQQAVNRDACQPVIDAQALVARAKEAEAVRADLKAARETVAKGAPKAADPLVANLTSLWAKATGSSDGLDFGAMLSLLIALIVELGAPISWAIWQMCGVRNDGDEALAAFKASLQQPLPDRHGPTVAQVVNKQPPTPPSGGGKRGRKRDPNVVDFVKRFREVNGRNPHIPEMRAQFPQLDKATLWRNAKYA